MAITKFNAVSGYSVGDLTQTTVIDGNANVTATNLTVNGISDLGNVGNVAITGGADGQILTTDGTGNLQWVDNSPTTVTYTANSIAQTNGVYVTGDLYSIQVFGDYLEPDGVYVLTDGTGSAPAWLVDVDFVGVTNFNRVVMNINYTLASGHIIYVQLYNFDTSFALASGTVTTTTGTNIVTVSSTTNMVAGQVIKFGTSVGGLTAGTAYYILSVPSGTELTVGTGTASGTIVALSNDSQTSTVEIQNWDNIGTYTGLGSYYAFALQVIDDTAYLNSGQVKLRLDHSNGGNSTHQTSIDYVALELSSQGPQGPRGPTGATGNTGPGVATGGTTGQLLVKNSNTNYDTSWSSNLSLYNLTSANLISGNTATFTGNVDIYGNLNASIGVVYANSGILYGNATTGEGALYAGVPGYTALPNTVAQFGANINNYAQLNFQNINTGNISSTDFVLTADNGNDTTHYINMGIGGGNWDGSQENSLGNAVYADDGYIYMQGDDSAGNLVLGTSVANTSIKLIVGGPNQANIRATLDATGLSLTGNLTSVNANLGNLAKANYVQGTLTTAAQPNITSLGTLTSLGVTGTITSGNATLGNTANANYFVGNGSYLTSITGANVTGTVANATYAVSSGTAGTVTTNAQPNITSVGTLSSLTVTSNITSGNANLGNLVTANYFTGDGSLLSNLNPGNIGTVANANYAAYAGNVVNATQSNITTLGTLTNLSVTGNASANILIANVATGTAPFIVNSNTVVANLNASLLSGRTWDENVTAYTLVSRDINGNISANNITGNIRTSSQPFITSLGTLSSLAVTGNANVGNINSSGNASLGNTASANYFVGDAGYLSNIVAANISGTVANANYAAYAAEVTDASQPNITSVGTLTSLAVTANANIGGNVNVTGNVLSTNANLGNAVRGNYFIGDATYLTNVPAGSQILNGNSNVFVNANANVTISSNGVSNIVVISDIGAEITGTLNVSSNLTSLNANLGNLTTSNYFHGKFDSTSNAQPNITSVGTLSSLAVTANANVGNLNTSGNALISGNLTVQGTTTYINVDTFRVEDPVIELGGGPNGAALSGDDGKDRGTLLHYYTSEPVDAFMGWHNTGGEFIFGSNVSVSGEIVSVNQYGNVHAGYFIGNGYALTDITGANVTGTVANAAYATNAGVATRAGTVTTNAQPNITSVGTLSSANITGNLKAGNANLGNLTESNYFSGDAGYLSNVQSSSIVGSVANAVYADAAGTATTATTAGTVTNSSQPNITSVGNLLVANVVGLLKAGNANLGNSVLANFFTGDGRYLTNLSAGTTVVNGNSNVFVNENGNVTISANGVADVLNVTYTGVNVTGTLNATGNIVGANANLGNVVNANYFVGNGINLTNIAGANVSGTVANATYAVSAGTAGSATTAGTVTTNAQPNITSTGTLSSLTVTGLITATSTGIKAANIQDSAGTTTITTRYGSISGDVGIYGNLTVGTSGTGTLISVDANLGNLATANYFSGDGGLLTNLTAGSNLVNGNSNIRIYSNANIAISSNGVANVVLVTSTGAAVTGNLTRDSKNITTFVSASSAPSSPMIGDEWYDTVNDIIYQYIYDGVSYYWIDVSSGYVGSNTAAVADTLALRDSNANIAANYFLGNGAYLTGLPSGAGIANGNSNISAGTANGNITVSITGTSNVAVFTSTGVNVAGYVNATGNITGGNITTSGVVNFSSASNVSLGANTNVHITGGTTGQYLQTDGSGNLTWATIATASLSNGTSNVSIPSVNGNVILGSGGNTTVTVTTTGANITGYVTLTGNVTAGNATLGNLTTSNYFSGNGSLLSSITGANVTGTVANATYAVSAGSATTAGTVTTNAQPNITSVGTLTNTTLGASNSLTGGNLVSATYLTGTLTTAAQPNVTSVGTLSSLVVTANANVGNINATNAVLSGNATITGNLTVQGTTNYINVDTIVVQDPVIELGGGANGDPLTTNDGKDRGTLLHYYNTAPVDAFMGWDNSNAEFAFGSNVTNTSDVMTFNTFGNIRASYFLGNGSQLVGTIANANYAAYAGVVTTAAQPNITSVGTLTSLGVSGTITAANITANTGVFTGNGSGLTNIAGANVTGTVANATYAVSAGSATTAGTVTTAAQPNITSVGTLSSVAVTGNANVGNLNATTDIFAGGNITATGNIVGGSGTGGSISGANLVSANYFTGTLTTAAQPNITSVGTLTTLGVTGDITSGGTLISNYSAGNEGGEIKLALAQTGTTLNTSVTLDIHQNKLRIFETGGTNRGGYFDITALAASVGTDFLTGGSSGYANSNVAAYLPTYTGNISAGNILTDHLLYANGVAWPTGAPGGSNTYVQFNDGSVLGGNANFTFNKSTSVLTVTGNISASNANLGNLVVANYFSGSGNLLSNLQAGSISGTVANANYSTYAGTVLTAAQPNITSTGTLSSLTVSGLLTTTGTGIKTSNIQDSAGTVTIVTRYGSISGDVGIYGNLTVGTSGTGNLIAVNADLGNLATANYYTGNGVYISNIAGANVSGTVANATYATSAGTATTAGTVTTNAQPNITSTGSLTGLTVSNSSGIVNFTTTANVTLGSVANLHISGGTADYVLKTDGTGNLSWVAQSGGAPGGSNTYVQFNDGSSFGGNAGFTYDKTNTTLTANNFVATTSANLGAVANVVITGGTADYVLKTDGAGNLSWTAQTGGSGGAITITVDPFTGNGVQTDFILSVTPTSINHTSVNYNGATLLRDAYSLTGSTITFDSAPATGSYIEVTTTELQDSSSFATTGKAIAMAIVFGF